MFHIFHPPPPPCPAAARVWNDFDNRFMRGLFGGKPHDNTDMFHPFNSVNSANTSDAAPNNGIGGVGVGVGVPGAIPPYQFNPALNPAEHMNLPTSPVRR